MGRRSNGEGGITRRKSGLWQGSLQIEGRRRVIYGKTRAEIVAKLDELRSQAARAGVLADPGRRTLGDLLMMWLTVKEPGLKPRTMADYRDTCDRYLLPSLGDTALRSVTPERIQLLYAHWQQEGKHRTALKVHQVMAPACALAVRWGWLASNPCDRVDRPRYQAKRKELWTAQQLQTFLEGTSQHWLYPFWLVAVSTGARLGELLALTWADVDLTAGTVRISKARQQISGVPVTSTPKTRAGTRTITLPSAVLEALHGWRAQQAEQRLSMGPAWRAGEHVFSGLRGDVLSANTVQDSLPRECQRLDLPRMTPHSLRHLHASLLLTEGLPIPAVSQRLGHANPAITMSTYAHFLEKDDAQATEAIGRALAK